MYQGFQLKGFDEAFFEKQPKSFDYYVGKGTKTFNDDRINVEKSLEKYLLSNGRLSGERIEQDWFPEIHADVFLSHSHRDEDLVFALAGWLQEEMGLRAFVDSGVWGYANDLLQQVDDAYCKTEDGAYYSYPKRNISTSHVHMMLSVALTKMIDRCECFMLVKTPESVKFSKAVEEVGEEKTLSPWIYAELEASRVIRENEPQRDMGHYSLRHDGLTESVLLQVEYPAELEHLVPLTNDLLNEWRDKGQKGLTALDILYQASDRYKVRHSGW